MKIMISQPMRGKTQEEIIKEREGVVSLLTGMGFEVLESIFEDSAPESCDKALFLLGKSFCVMSEADGVLFMDGWEKTDGCFLEHEAAKRYKKKIFYSPKDVSFEDEE